MDSIALRANVSKRTLYKHFPSKKHLLDEIIRYLIAAKNSSLDVLFNSRETLEGQLVKLIVQKINFCLSANDIKLAKLILSELLKDDGFHREHIQTVLTSDKASLTWIKDAQKHGLLLKTIKAADQLSLLNDLIHGLVIFPILFGKKSSYTKRDIGRIAKMFLCVCEISS